MSASSKPVRRHRRVYSEQFRAEAVAMVVELGKPASQVAKDLDLNLSTLTRWVAKERGALEQAAGLGAGDLAKLQAENAALRMENEFLKKAAAFFAKESM
jgi:transposase